MRIDFYENRSFRQKITLYLSFDVVNSFLTKSDFSVNCLSNFTLLKLNFCKSLCLNVLTTESNIVLMFLRYWPKLPFSAVVKFTWDMGNGAFAKMGSRLCISDGMCFWRRNMGLKRVEKCTQLWKICVWYRCCWRLAGKS